MSESVNNNMTLEQSEREQFVTSIALKSFEDSSNARLKNILQSLTKHLHEFAREVRLTEEEWNAGIKFLTNAGHITTDTRQEFVLLSDVLGVSMQTIAALQS